MDNLKNVLHRTVWFLDYDGSVCPHQELWEPRRYSAEEILTAVKILSQKSAGVFWNTGRRVESLQSVNPDFLRYSGFFIHGSVFWESGKQEKTLLAPELPTDFVNKLEDRVKVEAPFIRFEAKPTALRFTPFKNASMFEVESYCRAIILPENLNTWEWYFGPRGAELLLKNFNKGSALTRGLLNCSVESLPVAVGDDFQDSHAVRVAIEKGGYAILVGENCGWISQIPHHPEQIKFFENPDRVLQFFKDL